jgi:hypothetical protein
VYRYFLLLLLTAPTAASAQSLWDHNDSIVELKSSGLVRQFIYSKPRAGLSVTPGTVLFSGTKTGDAYTGTAYSFIRNCPPLGYAVSGPVASDQRSVTMTGKIPRRDSSCKVTHYSDDVLVFRFRDQSAGTSPATPSPSSASPPSASPPSPVATGPVTPAIVAPSAPPAAPDSAVSCGPTVAKVDQVSFSIAGRVRARQQSCATRENPARFNVGAGAPGLGILVRPTSGDIDVFLSQGGNVVDASLHKNRLSELIVLPQSAKQLELTVVAATPVAHFDIALVDVKAQPGSPQDNQWIAFALRVLGYDLVGPLDASESRLDIADQRSIMAYQATEGGPITGHLTVDQMNRLLTLAAVRVDVTARIAAEKAGAASRRAIVRNFSDIAGSAVSSDAPPSGIQGRLSNGKFFGIGHLNSGQVFEGEWLDGPDNESQRPDLGAIRLSKDCIATIKTNRLVANYGLSQIMESAIGVIRFRNRPIFAGQLSTGLPQQARSCTSPDGGDAGQ